MRIGGFWVALCRVFSRPPAAPAFTIVKVALEPGDVLVLRTARRLSGDEIGCLRQAFTAADITTKLLVLEPGMEISVLHPSVDLAGRGLVVDLPQRQA